MFFDIVAFNTGPDGVVVYSKTDRADYFQPGLLLQIQQSTNNDGIYTVASASYDTNTQLQTVVVVESINAGVGSGKLNGSVYTLNFSDDTVNPPLIIVPHVINQSTSISIVGRGAPLDTHHDALLTQNMIVVMENSASENAPTNPTIGQTWFDSATNNMMVWDDTQWVSFVAPGYVGIRFFDSENGNSEIFLTGDENDDLSATGQTGVAVIPSVDTGIPTDSIFRVLSATGIEELRVDQSGSMSTVGLFAVTGSATSYTLGTMSVGSNSADGNDFQTTGNVNLVGDLRSQNTNLTNLVASGQVNFSGNVTIDGAYNLNGLSWDMSSTYEITNVPSPTDDTSLIPKDWFDTEIVEASKEFLEKKLDNRSNIPVTRIGNLNYLPLDVSGSFESPLKPFDSFQYVLREANGVLVGLRVGFNGATFNVCYFYNLSGNVEPLVMTNTIYSPPFLTPTQYVSFIYDSNESGFLARVSEPGQPNMFFWILTNGTLDSAFHTYEDVTAMVDLYDIVLSELTPWSYDNARTLIYISELDVWAVMYTDTSSYVNVHIIANDKTTIIHTFEMFNGTNPTSPTPNDLQILDRQNAEVFQGYVINNQQRPNLHYHVKSDGNVLFSYIRGMRISYLTKGYDTVINIHGTYNPVSGSYTKGWTAPIVYDPQKREDGYTNDYPIIDDPNILFGSGYSNGTYFAHRLIKVGDDVIRVGGYPYSTFQTGIVVLKEFKNRNWESTLTSWGYALPYAVNNDYLDPPISGYLDDASPLGKSVSYPFFTDVNKIYVDSTSKYTNESVPTVKHSFVVVGDIGARRDLNGLMALDQPQDVIQTDIVAGIQFGTALFDDGTYYPRYSNYNTTVQGIFSITSVGLSATVTTPDAHGVTMGDLVEIRYAQQTPYNGYFIVGSTPTPTTLTITLKTSTTSPALGGNGGNLSLITNSFDQDRYDADLAYVSGERALPTNWKVDLISAIESDPLVTINDIPPKYSEYRYHLNLIAEDAADPTKAIWLVTYGIRCVASSITSANDGYMNFFVAKEDGTTLTRTSDYFVVDYVPSTISIISQRVGGAGTFYDSVAQVGYIIAPTPTTGQPTSNLSSIVVASVNADSSNWATFGTLYDQPPKLTFAHTAINTGTDRVDYTSHGLLESEQFVFSANGGTVPGGLVEGGTYYVTSANSLNFKLSANMKDAQNGVGIDFVSQGSGTFTLTAKSWSCPDRQVRSWFNSMVGVHPTLGPNYSSTFDLLLETQIRTEVAYQARSVIAHVDNTAITDMTSRVTTCFEDMIENGRRSSYIDPLMIVSIQPTEGFNVYISETPMFIDGAEMSTVGVKTIDLAQLFPYGSPPEYIFNTFFVYAELKGGIADVNIYNVQTPSTNTSVFIGTVTTGLFGVTSIDVEKTTTYNGLGLTLSMSPDSIIVSDPYQHISQSFINKPIRTTALTTNSLLDDDENGHILFTAGSATTYTILNDSTVNLLDGTVISFSQQGTGQVTLTADVGVTLNSAYGTTATRVQYSRIYAKKVSNNTWIVYGDVAP